MSGPLLRSVILSAAAASALACQAAGPQRSLIFDRPAEAFTESCVLGNGRLGAMVFGGVDDERVVLNEEGMWSGSPQEADRQSAAAALPEIRQLLLAGRNFEAEALVNRHFTCAGAGSGYGGSKNLPYGCYQVLGDLRLRFHPESEETPTHYARRLGLSDASVAIEYVRAGVKHSRAAFCSAPDEAFVYRIEADRPGQVSCDVWLTRPEGAEVDRTDGQTLVMRGQLADGKEGDSGVRYVALLHAEASGGEVTTSEGKLRVRGADALTLIVTAATDIKSFAGRAVDDPLQQAKEDLSRASKRSYQVLARRAREDHRRLYDRVWLTLGDAPPADAEQVATLFDYGRYLLIGSSRPGGLPANLQGIWAEELQTPWNGDWHANINVQMNYWPAETCNLPDLTEPLTALVGSLVEPGGQTARQYYDAPGWVAHLLLNPWWFTSPGESASWGATPTCSAWLCQHLWDHYLFTGDRRYLERVYPILKGASQFYAAMLIEEPQHNWLVTAPSNSPENAFVDDQGRNVHTCMGPAMDQQLLRYLFDATIQSAKILGKDEAYAKELRATYARLAPTQIGTDGRVMEWLAERNEADPHHRHVSHLWGLYPGSEIGPMQDSELAEAARRTLDARGDDGTGWAIAYKACLWARLHDGDRALKLMKRMLRTVEPSGETQRWHGGVYPNLLCSHPPFQIDGNFGATAAVAEMLVQSRYDNPAGGEPPVIELLPALPTEWRSGEVHGLVARGGIEIDMVWADGELQEAVLLSEIDREVDLRVGDQSKRVTLVAKQPKVIGSSLGPTQK